MQIKNVAMIGAGAIGGVYAYSLHNPSFSNLSFLLPFAIKAKLSPKSLCKEYAYTPPIAPAPIIATFLI